MKSNMNMIRRIINEELRSVISRKRSLNEMHGQDDSVSSLLDELRALITGAQSMNDSAVYDIVRALERLGVSRRKATLVGEAAFSAFDQPEGVLFDEALEMFDDIANDIRSQV